MHYSRMLNYKWWPLAKWSVRPSVRAFLVSIITISSYVVVQADRQIKIGKALKPEVVRITVLEKLIAEQNRRSTDL